VSTYVLKRLLAAVPTLLVLVTLTFFLMHSAPGGPFDRERPLPPEVRAQVEAAYHLNESTGQQYLRYLGGLMRGDLGPSFQYSGYSVAELMAAGLPVSLQLGLTALTLALLLGCGLGIAAALRARTPLDHALRAVALAGLAIPNFVVAPLLILLFAVTLGWLPASGWHPGHPSSLLLPVIVLALPQVAYIARLMRGSMIEVLRHNYIRTARAKGLPERVVVLRHALKPALLPVLSYLGPAAAGLITGSVVVEQIFNLPGIGRYFVQGAINRDYTLVLGVVVYYGAVIVFFNLVVDLLYGVLDPRVKHHER
jgi:oligopeptide transport system permease protein